MTRALLEQALDALTLPIDRWNASQSKIVRDTIAALRAELAKPEQKERKPCHTEAEVQVLLNMCDPHYSRKAQEKVIRRILKVPA